VVDDDFGGAAEKFEFPAWFAVTTQLPVPLVIVTVPLPAPPEIVHAPDAVIVAVNPELAVAETPNVLP
jgi:hypothetical protein